MEKAARASQGRLGVLFLITESKGTAVYVRAYHLAKQLVRRGHAVTLMAVSSDLRFGSRTGCEAGVRLIETPNFLHSIFGRYTRRLYLEPGTGIFDIMARVRECRSERYDVIQLFDHGPNVALPFYLSRGRVNSRFISDWCDIYHFDGGMRCDYGFRLDWVYGKLGFAFRKYSRFVEFDLRRSADGVTAISRNLLDFAVAHGVAPERVSLVEGGADVDAITPLPKIKAREKLGLPAGARIVGFMGTFQRDLDIVIKSLSLLKHHLPDAYLLVIGTPFPWARQTARDHGIAERYLEAGRCSDELLPYYLASTDVLALPLKDNLFNQTRWPNKIGEYLACGRPVVVSDVGNVASLVREYGTGLTAQDDAGDFSRQLMTLLSDPTLAQEMGQRARQLACGSYSWALQAEKLEDFYYRIMEARRPDRNLAPSHGERP
jgi:glycosyltransferase involved in cell wall biosynthesis